MAVGPGEVQAKPRAKAMHCAGSGMALTLVPYSMHGCWPDCLEAQTFPVFTCPNLWSKVRLHHLSCVCSVLTTHTAKLPWPGN